MKSNGIPAAPVHLFDPPTKIENEPGEESRHTKSTTNHSPTHSNAGIELNFDFLIHLFFLDLFPHGLNWHLALVIE